MDKLDVAIIDCEASSRLTAPAYLAWQRIKEAAKQAQQPAALAVPEGYALVPVAADTHGDEFGRGWNACRDAMLAAAPKVPHAQPNSSATLTSSPELVALPAPAFRLTWRDGRYLVSKPDIGDTDCYTAEQVERLIRAIAPPREAEPVAVPVRVTPRDGKWVYSDNDEVFSSFDHETELSAITDALDYYADAETIYVGQVKTLDVRRMIRAECLLENIGERAYDDFGEAAECWPELSKDQQVELEGVIADYILSKSPADFYSVENMRTYTREQAEAMLAAAERKGGES